MFVNDNKIKILKQIIDETGAKVVLSSTWRKGWQHLDYGIESDFASDFIELKNKLLEYDIELYDRTVIFDVFGRVRGDEIQAYLDAHDDIEGYVIIDDLPGRFLRPCSAHLLQTSTWKGLMEKHIKVAKRILEMEYKNGE